jgi:hypothetical protein
LRALAAGPTKEAERNLLSLVGALAATGTDQDEIPGAVGEFGLCVTNPIPTHTMFGSRSYLASLRTASGGAINYFAGAPRFPVQADIRSISTRSASRKAPEGFQLVDLDIEGELIAAG